MESLYYFIRTNTAGLYDVLCSSSFFFIDYWSFIHFGSGVFLMVTARAMKLKRIWSTLFLVLCAYEILELGFIYFSIKVFLPETLPDQATDIVIGMLGGWCASHSIKPSGRFFVKQLNWLSTGTRADALTAAVMACCWVGYYGYNYNVPFLNSPYINWWAFILWTVGLYGIMNLHRKLRRSQNAPTAAISVWLMALAVTFMIEFIGYSLLEIRETGGYPPLFLNMIHGTALLKFCYIIAAPAALVGSALVSSVLATLSQKLQLRPSIIYPESIMRLPEAGASCED